MSGHTPGPWAVGVAEDGTAYVQSDPSAFEPPWVYKEGRTVAAIPPGERRDANARLFAAAPDLLEAAKHAAMEWRLHGQLTDSARVLEAAIAKAEGR